MSRESSSTLSAINNLGQPRLISANLGEQVMCRELEYKLGPGAEQLEQQPPLGPFPDPSRTLLVQARSRRSRTTSPSASACPSLPTRARCAPQMRSPRTKDHVLRRSTAEGRVMRP